MNDFHLFTYKKKQFIFSILIVYNFQKKKKNYLHLLYQKNLLQNFNLGTNYFYLLLLGKNEFLQFYLQKYFNFVFI